MKERMTRLAKNGMRMTLRLLSKTTEEVLSTAIETAMFLHMHSMMRK